MKKLIALIIIATILILCLVSCGNKKVFDFEYDFTEASVYLDGTWQRVKIKNWTDYEDGDQIQITLMNGEVYLFHSANCTLIKKP